MDGRSGDGVDKIAVAGGRFKSPLTPLFQRGDEGWQARRLPHKDARPTPSRDKVHRLESLCHRGITPTCTLPGPGGGSFEEDGGQ